ncbi:hypothetical protein BK133_19185 [Paenibacillus sp. FSL H8-0548]|uniref:hypothetical protein n=1 Tax=Paenibacillus sp. FSL H8-0548 TaxID=1920422 RepID=UPI00096CCE15|nr:hypothetical protein [Paenibacillus sp. FSL H8-0548]OMF27581.1 hypothetical protein BK133_19185 [Paenibacillus sp. FSL H8-0548]
MKLLQSLFLSVMVVFVFVIPAYAENRIPEDVHSFAGSEGLNIIKKGFLADPAGYGYSIEAGINELVLGEGRQLYYVNPELLKKADNSLIEITEAKEHFAYVILYEGKPKSIMVISRTPEKKLEVFEFGGRPDTLAAAFELISKQTAVNSESRLIRLKGEFVVATKTNNKETIFVPELINLSNGSEEINDSPAELAVEVKELEAAQLIKSLKEIQLENSDKDGSGALTNLDQPKGSWIVTIGISILLASLVVAVVYYILKRKPSKTN